MIISQENVDRLLRNSRLLSLYDNTYLRDTDNENFRYVKDKFFKHEDYQKAALINTGVGLFNTVPNILANYVSNPESDEKINLIKATKDYCLFGFAVVGLQMKENLEGKKKASMISLPSEGYFIQDGVQYLTRFYKKNMKGISELYALIQGFYPGYTENKLYKIFSTGSLNLNTPFGTNSLNLFEVPLDTIQETSGMEPIAKHPRDHPAIYLILEDDQEPYPTTSEIELIKNQAYAMDRKKVMFDCEFLKNVENFMLAKGINMPANVLDKREKGTRIDFADLGRVIHGASDSSLEFVNNNNPLIQSAMDSQKDDMRLISTITSIPLDFLGMDTAHGSLGKGSRGLLHGSFVKKIEYIRTIRDKYLPSIIKDLEEVNSSEESLSYNRPDVFSQSDAEILDEVVIARTNGLISKERAIMLYMGYTEEQAKEEMQKIDQESLSPIQNNESTNQSGNQNNGSATGNDPANP